MSLQVNFFTNSIENSQIFTFLRIGAVRGGYDGLIVLSCVDKSSFPTFLQKRLTLNQLAADLVQSLTVLMMTGDDKLGQVRITNIVHLPSSPHDSDYCSW